MENKTYRNTDKGFTWLLTDQTTWRKRLTCLVRDYEWQHGEGSFVTAEVHKVASSTNFPLAFTWEEPMKYDADTGTYFGKIFEMPMELAQFLGEVDAKLGNTFAVSITSPCLSSGSNSRLLSVSGDEVVFIDTHKSVGGNGQEKGMTIFRMKRVWSDVARFLVTELVARGQCKQIFDLTALAVDWPKTLAAIVSGHARMQKMIALKPVLSLDSMLPGDFPRNSCFDSALLQLCVTGMKLFPLQEYLVGRMCTYELDRCVVLDTIVAWLLDGYVNCVISSAAVAAHGDNSHATGPTVFLKQLYILTKEPRTGTLSDAPAYVSQGNGESYYVTEKPTFVLRLLEASFEHGFPRDIPSAEVYIETQHTVCKILAASMVNVSTYTAPYLAKKLVHFWADQSRFEFTGATIHDLVIISADPSAGLKEFPACCPASALADMFAVRAPLWPMWYCLVGPVEETAEFISSHIGLIGDAGHLFVMTNRFAPNLHQLMGLATGQRTEALTTKVSAILVPAAMASDDSAPLGRHSGSRRDAEGGSEAGEVGLVEMSIGDADHGSDVQAADADVTDAQVVDTNVTAAADVPRDAHRSSSAQAVFHLESIWRLEAQISESGIVEQLQGVAPLGLELAVEAAKLVSLKNAHLQKLGELPVCQTCGIARPSLHSARRLAEIWSSTTSCGYCFRSSPIADKAHGLSSLHKRCTVELTELLAMLREEPYWCTEASGASRPWTKHQLRNVTKALTYLCKNPGEGQFPRVHRPRSDVAFVGQLQRTLALLHCLSPTESELSFAYEEALSLAQLA